MVLHAFVAAYAAKDVLVGSVAIVKARRRRRRGKQDEQGEEDGENDGEKNCNEEDDIQEETKLIDNCHDYDYGYQNYDDYPASVVHELLYKKKETDKNDKVEEKPKRRLRGWMKKKEPSSSSPQGKNASVQEAAAEAEALTRLTTTAKQPVDEPQQRSRSVDLESPQRHQFQPPPQQANNNQQWEEEGEESQPLMKQQSLPKATINSNSNGNDDNDPNCDDDDEDNVGTSNHDSHTTMSTATSSEEEEEEEEDDNSDHKSVVGVEWIEEENDLFYEYVIE